MQTLLAFAAMLTATGRVSEGLALAPEVLNHPRLLEMPRRLARFAETLAQFLRYAHGDDAMRSQALAEIRARLDEPSKSWGWVDLGCNATAAAAAGHPAADLVAALAKALQPERGKAEEAFAELDRCKAWRG